MNFNRQSFLALATAVIFSVSAPAFSKPLPVTSFWAQRKITSGKFPIHSACIMPPHARITRIGIKGAEPMTLEAENWAAALENTVESHLKSDGIAINSATNPLSTGASADEIGGVISEVEQKFSSVLPLIRKNPDGLEKSAYTLGDQVGSLPCSESSDVLVFVQGLGQLITPGRANMTALVGGPDEDAVLLITIADSKTGEIIGFIQVYPNDSSILEAEDAFGQKLYQQLLDMNIGNARANAKAQRH